MLKTLHGYRILRSGDLRILYRNGEIRQVCLGRIQVLNAIYAAVRDQNWTTLPFTVDQENIEVSPVGFTIEAHVSYSLEKILYSAKISIEAEGNRLQVRYKGEAGSTFLRNRIGLCILHPIKECKGKSVLISHPNGNQSEGRFPQLISPDQPFFNISGMTWEPGTGINAKLNFDGEVFESEDQRNWTDASYKTYCTPLSLPFPAKVEKGDQVDQSVTLVVEPEAASGDHSATNSTPSTLPEKRTLNIDPQKTFSLPGQGIGRSAEATPLTREESEILSTLPFNHYRVDLYLAGGGWKKVYDSSVREQVQLGWPLELALHFGNQPKQELDAFLQHFTQFPADVHHFLVFDQEFLSNNRLLTLVVPRLKVVLPDTPVGGGTDANFAELNRNPPDTKQLDFITYSICPQIHAFDNLTIVENLQAQSDSVSSARCLLNKPISIGAITLKQRFNPVATDEDDMSLALPESDPRQHSSFTAGWTLSSIRNLAFADATSLTYFETVGPRGILSRQDLPERNSPLFQLFKEILAESQSQVVHTDSSHPLEFDAIALQGQKKGKLLLTNYTERELSIELTGLPGLPQKLSLKPSEITKITYIP